MKAFLYSCLVAAVGAVDQHAQTTLDTLKDPNKILDDMATQAPQMSETTAPVADNGQAHNS